MYIRASSMFKFSASLWEKEDCILLVLKKEDANADTLFVRETFSF